MIQTRVRPDLLQRTFRRALWLAVPGGLLLVSGYLFLLGIALIALGLVPYRRLMRLRTQPDQLIWDANSLLYLRAGKPKVAIPQTEIERIEYYECRGRYGAVLWLTTHRKMVLPFFERDRVNEIGSELVDARLQDVMHAHQTH